MAIDGVSSQSSTQTAQSSGSSSTASSEGGGGFAGLLGLLGASDAGQASGPLSGQAADLVSGGTPKDPQKNVQKKHDAPWLAKTKPDSEPDDAAVATPQASDKTLTEGKDRSASGADGVSGLSTVPALPIDLAQQMALMGGSATALAAAAQPKTGDSALIATASANPELKTETAAAARNLSRLHAQSAQLSSATDAAAAGAGPGASGLARRPNAPAAGADAQSDPSSLQGAGASTDASAPASTLSLNAVTQDAAAGRKAELKAQDTGATPLSPQVQDSFKHLLGTEQVLGKGSGSEKKTATVAEAGSSAPAGVGTGVAGPSTQAVNASGELAGGNANGGGRSTEESVAEQVSYWIHQKRQGAELTLDGGNGQSVGVSISMMGNEAHVAFHTSQAQTREMISSALPELRNLLQGEGVVLAGVTVGDSGNPSAGSGGRGQGGAEPRAARVSSLGAGASSGGSPVMSAPQAVNTRGALDLFV